MNALETAINHAFIAKGNSKEANKAYLEFIKANFLIPIEKTSSHHDARVLFLEENDQYFLPVFSSKYYLKQWVNDISNDIQILDLSGVNLLKGLGEHVTICLNAGSDLYKEFNPNELARMRSMVLKLFGN